MFFRVRNAVLLLTALSLTTTHAITTLSIDDIASFQRNQDGSYDVICRDLSREKVSDLDLKLNNVCPRLTTTESMGILSVQKREDGRFDVLCQDLARKVATKEEILTGQVCSPPAPPPPQGYDVSEGVFYPESADSFFCDSYTLSNKENNGGQVVSFNLTCPDTSPFRFTCEENKCQDSEGRTIGLERGVLDRFAYSSRGYHTFLIKR